MTMMTMMTMMIILHTEEGNEEAKQASNNGRLPMFDYLIMIDIDSNHKEIEYHTQLSELIQKGNGGGREEGTRESGDLERRNIWNGREGNERTMSFN